MLDKLQKRCYTLSNLKVTKGGINVLDVKALKAEMVRNGYNNITMAKELGITPRTFTSRLKTGDFGSKEIEVMMDKLKINNPMDIFFAASVT